MWLFSLKPRNDALTCSFRGKMVLVFYPPFITCAGCPVRTTGCWARARLGLTEQLLAGDIADMSGEMVPGMVLRSRMEDAHLLPLLCPWLAPQHGAGTSGVGGRCHLV